MSNFYDLETFDFRIIKGDTVNFEFELEEPDGTEIDLVAKFRVSKFSMRNPMTDEVIILKEHDDSVEGGKGIYCKGDSQLIYIQKEIDKKNQMLVILEDVDTKNLFDVAYPYDIEIFDPISAVRITAVKATIYASKDVTINV
jgi:hypothetical protein